MEKKRKKIETCFALENLPYYEVKKDDIIIVIDILRATTSICTAFMNGAHALYPFADIDQVKVYKGKGMIVAAERDGKILPYADMGNSPSNFTSEKLKEKDVAYSTTNGTRTIEEAAKLSSYIWIGSFLNLSALAEAIHFFNRNVLLLCAGWKGKFSLEDSVFAGALAEKLLESKNYYTICDSTLASFDLWMLARKNLWQYMQKAANRNRLRKLGLDHDLPFCFQIDQTSLIPFYHEGVIEALPVEKHIQGVL